MPGRAATGRAGRVRRRARTRPSMGLALAGGGPLGGIYEVGALLALADSLDGVDLSDLDVYVGVSSGGFVAAALANGISPTQMYRLFIDDGADAALTPEVFLRPALSEFAHRATMVPNAMLRSSLVKTWRDDMVFIVDWTAKQKIDWPYLPVIHTEIAESHIKDKNYPMAIQSANKAVELNPGYIRAYLLLQDIYEQLKDRKKALAVITEGLKQVPNSKALQRQYKELGGSIPFPEPYPKLAAPDKHADAATAASSIPATDEETVAPMKETESPRVQPADNPYCRFCP